ncbi:sel1 repeat family protein [Aggregatibacter actinomycetemcomitans]|nr:sel1 repeat family protein [Aggregatibacter actinomycetemcomitans]
MKYIIILTSLLIISCNDKENIEKKSVCTEHSTLSELEKHVNNDAYCEYLLGLKYYNRNSIEKDFGKAHVLIKEAAEKGVIKAKIDLSRAYERGIGVEKNYTLAFEWMNKAADDGDPEAINNIGVYYDYGIGVTRDPQKSIEYYKKAADLGNNSAMYNLGIVLFYGEEIIKDEKKALFWIEKSANLENIEAITNLYSIYKLQGNIQKSMYWLNKGIEKNLPIAFFNLGYEYSKGNSLLMKDDAKAFENYLKSAEMGVSFAQNNLANWYLSGYYVKKDEKEAIKWYLKAAENNLPEAMYALYQLYSEGTKDISQDLEKANYWLEKAKQNGFVPAQ